MARAFGFLLFVLTIWVALEVYTEGVDRAFGGRLAFLAPEGHGAEPAQGAEGSWAGERAAEAVESARDRRLERVEHLSGSR